MMGLMQDRQLLISTLLDHAAQNHSDTEIVSKGAHNIITRLSYAKLARRTKQLANALQRLGLNHGDRVATLAWNTNHHFELYYAVAGSGMVCHTINPRLFLEQIVYIIQHAQDRIVFFDPFFSELVAKLAPQCPSVERWIALCPTYAVPTIPDIAEITSYEHLIGLEKEEFTWPVFDENTASSLCYTSGTTGNPKGVLYSHRSTVLHSYASTMPDTFGISAADVVLPASSMYHANAWGVPYAATLAGSKFVLPGQQLDGASIVELMEAEGVTVSFGVPTIWLGVAQYLEKEGRSLSTLKRLVIGGAACPLSLMKTFSDRYGIEVIHLWGMTETSPLGTVNKYKPKHATLTDAQRDDLRVKQGRLVYGCEMKIIDDVGKALPHDGVAFGDLMVRGWWVTRDYFKGDQPALDKDGWFHTGDVATIDPDGYMRLTDRSKDVIKSGGEWISSIDLENAAVGHPAVAEAAVIGVYHPKWDERPLLVLRMKHGQTVTKPEMLEFLRDKIVKWWMPDDVVTVDDIPHTATGKILKTKLREQFKDYQLPTA
jgi:3-(methylthio)propionyl---CoA ligase